MRIVMLSFPESMRQLPPLSLFLLIFVFQVQAGEFRFSRQLSDGSVIQRDKPILIKGFANKNAQVSLNFGGQSLSVKADEKGRWSAQLGPMKENLTPQDLTATSSGKSISIKDISIGDVFLFAYQSSIDVSVEARGEVVEGLTDSSLPVKVMHIKTIPSAEPQDDLSSESTVGWEVFNSNSSSKLSTTAFHLAQKLSKSSEVPVGIIDLSLGGSFSLAWLDTDSVLSNDEHYGRKTRIPGYANYFLENVKKFKAQTTEEKPEDVHHRDWVDTNPVDHPLFPARGYNSVLHPLKGLPLKAAIVQIGSDYAYLAYEKLKAEGHFFDREQLNPAWWTTYLYRKQGYRAGLEVLPRVPTLWRKYFGDRDLPMAFVTMPGSDIGSYAIHHHEMREVIRQMANDNPNVGIIVADPEHIPFSGQPADAKTVAERSHAWIAGAVLGTTDQSPSGPLFERAEISFNKARVIFKNGTARGLKATGKALEMFDVAAIDAEWHPASARIDGETVVLESDTVNQIAYVRFNYKKQPDNGLVNDQNLPAVPFRMGDHKWIDVPRNTVKTLPSEYTTPADEWKSEGVAIISGGGASYKQGPGLLGPTGVQVRPFGPNMRVIKVMKGSPGDGNIHVGDVIYKVNGKYLESNHLHMVGRAVAYAESDAGQGKIQFSLRREKALLDVDLKIEVLGTISSTTPYDCPKSERLIKNCEAYLAERDGLSTDYAGGGWLHTDLLFLLAAGTPEHQGLVRRFVYQKSEEAISRGRVKGGWTGGAGAMLLGEYYLATGDKSVLPALKVYCEGIAADQCKPDTFPGLTEREYGGWRHNFPGGRGYGMMATIGYPNMIGMKLAMESGVAIDELAFQRGMTYFTDHQAEMGFNDYAAKAGMRLAPEPLDPKKMAEGMVSGHNGSRGLAAIFYDLVEDSRIVHLNSLYCTYAFNEANVGHASNFFNGMWTPIGASKQSKPAFIEFMKKHFWYQDLRRMYDHGYIAAGRHAGLGPNLALLVPRERLRILGAPKSVFGVDAPDILKPALHAHYAKDYPRAMSLAQKLLASGELTSELRIKTQQLIDAIENLQASISHDLAKVEALIKEEKFYRASLDLAQLRGVLPADNSRLKTIESALSNPDLKKALHEGHQAYRTDMRSLRGRYQGVEQNIDPDEGWESLTSNEADNRRLQTVGVVEKGKATLWKAKVVESVSKAPLGWKEVEFDDSEWNQGMLPFSWHLNHSLIARAKFNIEDIASVETLRVSTHPFRQQNIVVYINGKTVAKFNQCEANSSWVRGELKKEAIEHLRNGENTIAFQTTNDWRWASRSTPHNGGFGLKLDVKKK